MLKRDKNGVGGERKEKRKVVTNHQKAKGW